MTKKFCNPYFLKLPSFSSLSNFAGFIGKGYPSLVIALSLLQTCCKRCIAYPSKKSLPKNGEKSNPTPCARLTQRRSSLTRQKPKQLKPKVRPLLIARRKLRSKRPLQKNLWSKVNLPLPHPDGGKWWTEAQGSGGLQLQPYQTSMFTKPLMPEVA